MYRPSALSLRRSQPSVIFGSVSAQPARGTPALTHEQSGDPQSHASIAARALFLWQHNTASHHFCTCSYSRRLGAKAISDPDQAPRARSHADARARSGRVLSDRTRKGWLCTMPGLLARSAVYMDACVSDPSRAHGASELRGPTGILIVSRQVRPAFGVHRSLFLSPGAGTRCPLSAAAGRQIGQCGQMEDHESLDSPGCSFWR